MGDPRVEALLTVGGYLLAAADSIDQIVSGNRAGGAYDERADWMAEGATHVRMAATAKLRHAASMALDAAALATPAPPPAGIDVDDGDFNLGMGSGDNEADAIGDRLRFRARLAPQPTAKGDDDEAEAQFLKPIR